MTEVNESTILGRAADTGAGDSDHASANGEDSRSAVILIAAEGSAETADSTATEVSTQVADMRPVASLGGCGREASVTMCNGDRSEESSGGLGPLVAGSQDEEATAVLGHGTNGACVGPAQGGNNQHPTSNIQKSSNDQISISAAAGLEVLEEGGIGKPPEQWRIDEGNRRQEVLKAYWALVDGGMSKARAAKEVNQGNVTIWRWEEAFKKQGFNGLIPKTDKCGRKPVWEKLGYTEAEFKEISEKCRGYNLDLDSTTAALRLYAQSDECDPKLAAVILDSSRHSKHAIPRSLRNAAKIDETLRNQHKGPRRSALKGIWIPRKMDVLPGDVFTSDDTTPIFAWWVPWKESDEYPFGVKLMQGQYLPVIDVASQNPLVWALIGRETSSYRAADIWALFGQVFEQIGLPRLGFQLERGSWESNLIAGQEVSYEEREITFSRRVGGLRQLPTNVTSWHREKKGADFAFPSTLQTWTSFLPKSKSIEAFFNRAQTMEGTLWGCLGRDQMRAPFEKTKKIYEACRRNAMDPKLHFMSQEELLKRLNAQMDYMAHEPMEGEVFNGVPALKWEQAVKDFPLYQLPEELRYLYRRDWSVVQITSGWARIRPTHPITGKRYSIFYINPDVFGRHEGQEVVVYYDRQDFTKPAQIILARTGEFLCEAEWRDRRGSFLDDDQSGYDDVRQWRNSVVTAYGSLVKHAPSRQLPPEIAARRAEAKAAAAIQRAENPKPKVPEGPKFGFTSNPRTEAVAAPGIVTIDQRPAVTLPGSRSSGPTPEQVEKQRNRLAQQAARLRALQGQES